MSPCSSPPSWSRIYLTEGLHLSAATVGLILAVQPLVMAIVASPAGRLSDKVGSRGLAMAGTTVLAAGLFGLASVSSKDSQS